MRPISNTIYLLIIGFPIALGIVGTIWLSIITPNQQNDSNLWLPKNSEIEYLDDVNSQFDIEKVVQKEADFQTLNGEGAPNFGFTTSTVWLKFDLQGSCLNSDHKIIEIKNPLLNRVALYEDDGEGVRLVNEAGDNYFFSARQNSERNYCFAVKVPSERIYSYYIALNGAGEQLMAPLSVWTEQGLAKRNNRDQMIRGSYFGLIVFVLFFNLFIFFIIQERSALYYVYYNLFLLLLQLSLGGFAFQFLWPGAPYFANLATPLFASLSVFALIRFSQHFINIPTHFPRTNRYYQMAGYLLLANAAICFIPSDFCFQISILVVNGIALILNFAIIPTAIGVIRKGFKPARIFLAAFLLLVLTVFGFLATNIGLIQSPFFADYGLLIGSAAEVILLSLAIVVRFKSFKDDALKSLKDLTVFQAEQNTVLEQKVEERTTEIQQQKEEILSSIRYAERIQKNVLPSEKDLSGLFPNHFIIYSPKDIVSGDFYWAGKATRNPNASSSKEIRLFATADCTGHGVPGAMVSVLGCNLLRETVLQYPNDTPEQMLHHLEERLLMAINGTEHEHAGDGMDIALWSYDDQTRLLSYAGAHINIHICRGAEWIELKATRRPIGLRQADLNRPFDLHQIMIEKGDILYAWTDGLPDMMGGEKGKKWKTSGVLKYLQSISDLPLMDQQTQINTFIENYQKGYEQIDDITLTCVQWI